MEAVNNDLTKRAVMEVNKLEWIKSPSGGVWRKPLERDNPGEVARATTIVKYDKGSSFPWHIHGGGEEFIVLEGIFSDKENGDAHTGYYIRNPIDSAHTPYSVDGCIIFVKLRQMIEKGESIVRIDTTDDKLWKSITDGRKELFLFQNQHEIVSMEKWPSGFSIDWNIPSDEEIFILKGDLSDSDGVYPTYTWIRNPIINPITIKRSTTSGCNFWRKLHLKKS